MPNWVFNSIRGYSPEMHEKYKGEDTELDFNKVIPIPEEFNHTIASSINEEAKEIVRYREYYEDLKKKNEGKDSTTYQYNLKYDSNNPLRDRVQKLATRTAENIGYLAIENPDKSLNTLFEDKENGYAKHQYDKYVSIFGNKSYDHTNDFESVYNNYIAERNKAFEEDKKAEYHEGVLDCYSDIEDYGRTLNKLREKYGYETWYDANCENWGCKWNASESNYDEDKREINFDTPWSIPYPVIAKIAEDNPEAKYWH